MKLFVVYSQFIDDPSSVRGIYSTVEKALYAKATWKTDDAVYIEELELDVTYEDAVVLS